MLLLVDNSARLSSEAIREIEAIVRDHHILQDAVRWGLSQKPALVVAEIVVQDEFTHDVVLPFRDSLFLVYDTT